MTDALRATRRTVLRATGTTLAGVALAGCTSIASPRAERTADETATVAVGPGGDLVFDPDSLSVRPGTTVRWKWESDNHNIRVESSPDDSDWQGHEPLENAGFTYEHTPESNGTYVYFCQPHRSAGMIGEITVTEAPAATPSRTERPGTGPTETGSTPHESDEAVTDARGQSEVTVQVGPDGDLVFDPETLRISADATVRWVWKSDNHDIVVGEQPAAADWQGHGTIEAEAYTYTHAFSTEGRYEYWCRPHKAAGMTGTILVE